MSYSYAWWSDVVNFQISTAERGMIFPDPTTAFQRKDSNCMPKRLMGRVPLRKTDRPWAPIDG